VGGGGSGGGGLLLKTPVAGIPASDGVTAQFASCEEQQIDPSTKQITGTGINYDIHNSFSSPIAGEVFITAKQLPNGIWQIDAEDCT
jgi:hypothetical protein